MQPSARAGLGALTGGGGAAGLIGLLANAIAGKPAGGGGGRGVVGGTERKIEVDADYKISALIGAPSARPPVGQRAAQSHSTNTPKHNSHNGVPKTTPLALPKQRQGLAPSSTRCSGWF